MEELYVTHLVNHQVLTDVNDACEIQMQSMNVLLLLLLLTLITFPVSNSRQEPAVTINQSRGRRSCHRDRDAE